MLYYIREVVPRSLQSPQRVHRESTGSPHGVLDISDSPCGLHKDSSWTPHGLLMESMETIRTGRKYSHGFPWSPHGVHEESLWSPQSLHGVHGNPWGSVKYSKICGSHKSNHKLDICGRFCDGFASHTRAPLCLVCD
jgi:hypothetical protein